MWAHQNALDAHVQLHDVMRRRSNVTATLNVLNFPWAVCWALTTDALKWNPNRGKRAISHPAVKSPLSLGKASNAPISDEASPLMKRSALARSFSYRERRIIGGAL